MVSSLCRYYRQAVDMLDHAKTYHQNLTNQAGDIVVQKWTLDIEDAELDHKNDVSAMDIYAAKLARSESYHGSGSRSRQLVIPVLH